MNAVNILIQMNAAFASVSQDGSLASVIVGATQVIFTALAALIMDRSGRKVLLILSGQHLPFILPLLYTPIPVYAHVSEPQTGAPFPSSALCCSGVAMCVSEAAFGVYFKLSAAKHGNSTLLSTITEAKDAVGEATHADLSWLALTSMGVFITGN